MWRGSNAGRRRLSALFLGNAAKRILVAAAAILSTGLPLPAAAWISDCQTGQPAFVTSISTPDPADVASNRSYATNDLSAHWLNSAGSIVRNINWTSRPVSYFAPDNFTKFAFRSKTCSRDMELDIWTRNGYAVLRYDEATARGVFFRLNLEVPGG